MSVKIVYRPVNKSVKQGYLKIRIIENRVSKFKTLGIKINGGNWLDDKQRVSSKEPNHKKINEKIDEVLKEYNQYDNPTLALVTFNKTILQFYNDIISTTSNAGTKLKYEDVSKKFTKYLNSQNLTDLKFSQLTPQHVQSFWNYMRDNNCATNTANYNLKSFKAIINKAIKSGQVVYSVNPFSLIKLKFTETKHKTLSEIDINNLITTNYIETRLKRYNSLDIPLKEIANTFLFQLFSQGMRVSDMILLKWANITYNNNDIIIEYNQFKTQKPMRAKLTLFTLKLLNNRLLKYDTKLTSELKYYEIEKARFVENIEKATILLNEAKDQKKINDILAHKEDVKVVKDREFTRASWELTQTEMITLFDAKLTELNLKMYDYYGQLINTINQTNENDFVFYFLDKNKHFENYKTGEILNNLQYSTLTGKRCYYNILLKDIQKQCKINTKLTSHVARHTYTQLLLDNNADLSAVSQSLGHSNLTTTQTYISQLPNKSLLEINKNISNKFDS